MANTPNFAIPMPDPAADVDEEFYRLQQAWAIVDLALWNLTQALDGKAPALHEHAIGQITGLLEALAGKMDASATFVLDDLTDVSGATAAAIGYVLVKAANGQWQPSSAIAALGAHQHATGDIVGLTAAINAATANKAPLASPTFTGTPTAPTAAPGDSDTTIATTAFVTAAINVIKGGVAAAFDTLSEIATELGLKAAKAVTITGGGLVTGGGDLSANRALTVTKSSNAQAKAGTDDTTAMTPVRTKDAVDALEAVVAFVDFNGTGTPAIRASKGVSSITDNGTGDYTVNLSPAMPNANYAVLFGGGYTNQSCWFSLNRQETTSVKSTTAVRVAATINGAYVDAEYYSVAILR
ncbi:hypothetical protein N2599_14105 [Rhizobium sullae]|uniref:Uncharacterized protein n=1 Tax=Rhizobium sullae TaxID=50338 RepID=A0ABY5XFG8_RHISU|nr:hypothetical protein [Rhizobium sullae]UWU13278.1 hypothetical protein N2599_14105 [Rhizobium sullae]